jgi:hypothetical protein
LKIVGIQAVAKFITVFVTTPVNKDDERGVLVLRWNVKVQLLLRPASLDIGNVGNPGDTVSSGRIRLLRFGADLRVGGSDRRKKTANQKRARTKNRSPPETEKMPDHKKEKVGR